METSPKKWPRQMSFPFRLGEFEVFPETLELGSGTSRTKLEPKIMDLLVYFSSRAGEVLPKDQILAEVWGGTTVVEEALQRAVSVLRKALGDNKENPRYLETISKKGYRLVRKPHPLEEPEKGPKKDAKALRLLSPVVIFLALIIVALGSYFTWKEFFQTPIETPAPEADGG